MNKETRNAIERTTQRARKLLEEDFASQLAATFDVLSSGEIAAKAGAHLSVRQVFQRDKIVAAVEHKRATGMTPLQAVGDYLRDAAFTTLNRFVALKMLEARELVQECITQGDESAGYREFTGMAPGTALLPNNAGYRLYIESIFDELSTEMKVLFDRRDPASVLWPKRQTFEALLSLLNVPDLASIWNEDETIGWFYQFFNSSDERREMREASPSPSNSRELAVRNQFFTPRYVVQFLADNTLGRMWLEMREGKTVLADRCIFLVRDKRAATTRPKKDPRDLKLLDPACGSGHFLLYAFDLLLAIYEEAWGDDTSPLSASGRTLREDYSDLAALRRDLPALIVEHNLYGVDIDPRAAQITALALWLRTQRAYKDFGIAPSHRKVISRTHIVVAEPMPGDGAMVKAFAADLQPPLLGVFFEKMVGAMRLAGELGVLIQVEEAIATELALAREQFVRQRTSNYLPGLEPVRRQGELDLSGVDDDRFFHQAEGRIVEALHRFADSAAGGIGVRRRLFADDSAQGVALVDLLRTTFDVVLMNPPFGDSTPDGANYLERQYCDTRLDLFAAFCDRVTKLLEPSGLVGALTPRDGFFKKTLEGWRDLVFRNHMLVVADLGIGVLDSATVRVAAYVITKQQSDDPTRFFDLVDVADRDQRLATEVRAPKSFYDVKMSSFKLLPAARFLYWLPKRLWEVYTSAIPLENNACTPRYGLTTLSDERFCRLSFEVASSTIGANRSWAFMSKGGDSYPYGGVSNSLVRWQHNAAEMAEVNRSSNGQIAQTRRASKFYFLPAVTFSNRSVQFSVRWHPANFVFSVRGPVVVPLRASQAYLLGFFNSRLVRALIEMQTASQTYTSGVLKELRWVDPDEGTRRIVEDAATGAFTEVRMRLATEETDPFFEGLLVRNDGVVPKTLPAYFAWRRWFIESLKERLSGFQAVIDDEIAKLYGVSQADIERCERVEIRSEMPQRFPPEFGFAMPAAEALMSYLFGIAIGRWSFHVVEAVPRLDAAAPPVQPAGSPDPSAIAISVDDPGHRDDIVSLARCALEKAFQPSDADMALLERELGSSLRVWFAKLFFTKHLACYTAFGRTAPVYWQLSTPSASYSVWLYVHAFTRDTIYNVYNDFVTPKLALEERNLNTLRHEFGNLPSAEQRKRLATQELFVDELRAFRKEVELVAPLWNPNLDDGVLINFSPLWRLVPHHKAWQKQLREMWDALCGEKCDWAYLAMHLWPERVVRKCVTDRSLAIAHGLDDVFWIQGDDRKWKPRSVPTRPVEDLVRERLSPAVKAALGNLLEASGILRNTGGRDQGFARTAESERVS